MGALLGKLSPERKRVLVLAGIEAVVILLLVLIIGWEGPVGHWIKGFSNPVVKEVDIYGINSPYAILVQAKGGKSIASSLPRERIWPASMTKVMTALCAIERIGDLEKAFSLPEEAFAGLYEADASQAGFLPGERVRAIDLLYGAILPSGAECTNALAIMASGSIEGFVEEMNRKAKQLGMKNTHFVNTMGLHDENHYSTCEDMATLMRVAIRNKTLREILETDYYTSASTEEHPDGVGFWSTLFRNMYDPEVTAGTILGGKTGYTSEAGLCLASFGEVAGREYVLVTAGAVANGNPLYVYDALTLYGRVGEAAVELGYEP